MGLLDAKSGSWGEKGQQRSPCLGGMRSCHAGVGTPLCAGQQVGGSQRGFLSLCVQCVATLGLGRLVRPPQGPSSVASVPSSALVLTQFLDTCVLTCAWGCCLPTVPPPFLLFPLKD